MKKTIQRSNERGSANHGWLHARFTFSFSGYYNRERMGFGKIRVLNDDTIKPSEGFGTHPHKNMEIITIPTEGELAHKDNTGAEEVIVPGQIQVMSAGSGIMHSEYNNSDKEDARLFQIWIEPNKKDVKPRHETKDLELEKNKLTKIVSGDKKEDTLFIYQDTSLYLGEFDKEDIIEFNTSKERGVFIMVIEGEAKIEGELINKRDSIEIEEAEKISIKVSSNTKLLVIETLMN